MTDTPISYSITCKSSKSRSGNAIAREMLTPLLAGRPVVLQVEDRSLPKRKRMDRPLLFITPMAVYGQTSKSLVVSLQTHGCEIVNTQEHIKSIVFYRMGMDIRMANALAGELNLVFRGEGNGK